jgi:hypothetical protein
MTPTFNKLKPYGEVWGDPTGARYHQNGVYYDADGNPVTPNAGGALAVEVGPQPVLTNAPEGDGAADAAAAIAARQRELMLKAIPLLEKAQADVVAELADYDADLLVVMQEVEQLAKKRKTVLEALAAEIAEKAEQAKKDEAANTVSQPSVPAGTMAAQSQLAAQLGD